MQDVRIKCARFLVSFGERVQYHVRFPNSQNSSPWYKAQSGRAQKDPHERYISDQGTHNSEKQPQLVQGADSLTGSA